MAVADLTEPCPNCDTLMRWETSHERCDGCGYHHAVKPGTRFIAVRREGGSMEGIEWLGRGIVPRAGARGRYVEGTYGLRVEVIVEEVMSEEPDPAAFMDPDAPGGTSL